jgi:hypothetical protein
VEQAWAAAARLPDVVGCGGAASSLDGGKAETPPKETPDFPVRGFVRAQLVVVLSVPNMLISSSLVPAWTEPDMG